MQNLKVALLEDEALLLKDLKMNLEDTGMVDVVFYAASIQEFIEKMEMHKPEALLLDIDIQGESVTGLDMACKYKLPVLFISGKTNQFNTQLEDLDTHFEFPVMRLRKPVMQDALVRTLRKFSKEIIALKKSHVIRLKLYEAGWQNIPVDCISFLSSKRETSNNKEIYFTDRLPGVLVDFSFKNMSSMGFDADNFVRANKQWVVNKNHISKYLPKEHKLIMKAMNFGNKEYEFSVEISEDYRPAFRKMNL